MKLSKRQAVAPVLATLLMIAVAVAMSVIIFMWSQGFLSQTSSATGGQQGAQNQAAQSSISIETATFNTATSGTCATSVNNPCATIIVRNVGAVSVTLGSVLLQGSSSNSGFKISITDTTLPLTAASNGLCVPPTTTPAQTTCAGPKGTAITISEGVLTGLTSGDVINVKVSTTVGTFAQAQFTVP